MPTVSGFPAVSPRRLAATVGTLLLALGPTAVAFFTGGYFDGPRAWAGLGAWALVVIGVLVCPTARPLREGWIAVGGLAALAALSLLSMLWAPEVSDAYHAGQLAVVYLGTLLAAALLVDRSRARLIEPCLAAGVLIVIGYGLAGRFLPAILHYSQSASAEGRLEQPLTYWNAMGELAAIGVVIATRVAGDEGRPEWMRGAATAAVVPLGMGVYISFSRGALSACLAGLVALAVLAPRRRALAGLLAALAFGVLGGLAAAPFGAVSSLNGSETSQEGQGVIVLVIVVVLMLCAAAVSRLLDARVTPGAVALPAGAGRLATGVICIGLAAAIVLGAKESSASVGSLSGGAGRLTTLQSDRFDYWRVALRAFATEPLRGVGAGNWSVYWLRWRTISEGAQDAHSLPLQTLAELGVLGAAALVTFAAGIARAAAGARARTTLAAGPIAALVTYLVHAPLDWDWQMPAVTLPAIVLAGMMIALASGGVPDAPAWPDAAPGRPATGA